MKKTTILVITYNRLPILKECLARIFEYSQGEYELIVADDNSSDGTAEYCQRAGIWVVTGKNISIANNKNRGLYTAMYYTKSETILLLEDDCWPDTYGWNTHWEQITKRWHHVCYGPVDTWPKEYTLAGAGTVESPYICTALTAQIMGVTRSAVLKVGYFSPRFKGYGYEHCEWSYRFSQFGYFEIGSFICSKYGLTLADAGTFYNKNEVAANLNILNKLVKNHSTRRLTKPWKNILDKHRFLTEIEVSFAKNNNS